VNLFSSLRPIRSAPVARKRLQALAEDDRSMAVRNGLISMLHAEILDSISRHVAVDLDRVRAGVHRTAGAWRLLLDIEIPNRTRVAAPAALSS
jgi:septum formation topological specificity factor MinE